MRPSSFKTFRFGARTGIMAANRNRLLPAVAVLATLCTVVLVLLITEFVLPAFFEEPYHWDRRLMFFSEGKVFQNKDWGGFVYHPNATIRSLTFYITNDKTAQITKEYEYEIKTNSLGLVQLRDVDYAKPSILFLGDSYTEGQGASPWFYELEKRWPSDVHQIINGGILGTGVEAWGRLYKDLSSQVKIAKVVILFISDDWRRGVWQFPMKVLDCLLSHNYCSGSEGFYGLPQDRDTAKAHIEKMTRARIAQLPRPTEDQNILKRTFMFRRIIRPAYGVLRKSFLEEKTRSPEIEQFEIGQRTIIDIVNEVGKENVLFIHLPRKFEIDHGPDFSGKKARDFLSGHNLRFVDGFEICGLTPDDYHIDGHPNDAGYGKIVDCVERSVKAAFDSL